MKAYSPFTSGSEELEQDVGVPEGIAEMNISDATLVEYVGGYIRSFRKTVEEFFPRLAGSIPFYSSYPFHTTVVRFGPNGVLIAHRPDLCPEVDVRRFQDFDPPLTNICEIAGRLKAPVCCFDFKLRKYDSEESHLYGVRDALVPCHS